MGPSTAHLRLLEKGLGRENDNKAKYRDRKPVAFGEPGIGGINAGLEVRYRFSFAP